MLQGRAFQKLHGNKSLPVFLADIVDGADVRMIQSRSSLGFALKAAESLGIFGDFVGEEFERHKAAQSYVFSFVDDAHASAADFFNDAVVRNGLSDQFCPINSVRR